MLVRLSTEHSTAKWHLEYAVADHTETQSAYITRCQISSEFADGCWHTMYLQVLQSSSVQRHETWTSVGSHRSILRYTLAPWQQLQLPNGQNGPAHLLSDELEN